MTEHKETTYEEAEIVTGTTRRTGTDRATDAFEKFATEGASELRSNLFWAGFGTLFIFLLIAFTVIGLLIALFFWLLPFIVAAALTAFILLGAGSVFTMIRSLFSKK